MVVFFVYGNQKLGTIGVPLAYVKVYLDKTTFKIARCSPGLDQVKASYFHFRKTCFQTSELQFRLVLLKIAKTRIMSLLVE